MWPFTPKTTYVANTTPTIKAADLNDIQAEINSMELSLFSKDFRLEDDFLYNSGLWTSFGTTAVTFGISGTANNFGEAKFNSANNTALGITNIAPITCDFRLEALTRRGGTQANTFDVFGFIELPGVVTSTTKDTGFGVNAAGNWQYIDNGVTTTAAGPVPAGIAPQKLVLERKNATLYWYIDDVLVHSVATYSIPSVGANPKTLSIFTKTTVGTHDVRYDYVKYLVKRSTL